MTAELFSHLAEAYVGIAGQCTHGESEQVRNMRTAVMNVERSYEGELRTHLSHPNSQLLAFFRVCTNYVPAHARLHNVAGMLTCTLMKKKLAEWRKDNATAEKANEVYLQLIVDDVVERSSAR